MSQRDFRLDFCRGLALIFIFVDHVPGNPAAHWTLRSYAFCDAAEVFVLISGIASYLAYAPKFERFGFRAGVRAVGRRWLTIYFSHLLLFVGLAIGAALAARHFYGADYIAFLRFGWLFDRPREAIVAALMLRYLPTYVDILPLYLVLLAAAPVLIVAVRRWPAAACIGSIALYVAARLSGVNLVGDSDGSGWNFNPFAWQVLYVAGLTIGHIAKGDGSIRWRSRLWAGAAIGFAAFALLAAAPWDLNETGTMLFNLQLWPAEKTFLAPLRFLNVLALTYLFAFFVPARASIFESRWFAPLLCCGRNSLPVYAAGVVLSCAGYVAITEAQGTPLVHLAVNLVGAASLFLLAAALDRYYRVARLRPLPMPAVSGGAE